MSTYTILSTQPVEKGTIVITVTFTDETGAAVTPKTLTKTLTDSSGAVMNSISDVEVTVGLASTMVFVLTGDDLQIGSDRNPKRHFTLKTTYDSTNGTDLTLNVPIIFEIYNAVGIT